jgi:SNF2 family DNA or RNA helicase
MNGNYVSFSVSGRTFAIRIGPEAKNNIIFSRTLKSLISRLVTNYTFYEEEYTGETKTDDQLRKLILEVEGLCKRQYIEFESATREVGETVDQNAAKLHTFEACKETAIQARNNNLQHEYELFQEKSQTLLIRQLRPYQSKAAFFASKAVMSCNFSVPGSGKTTIAYALFAHLNSIPSESLDFVEKVLVIGPIASFQPWVEEFSQCFGPKRQLSVTVFDKQKQEEINEYCRSKLTSEITVINYEKIRRNVDSIILFLQRNKTLLVIDEAHRMKNPFSQTATAIRKLGNYPRAKLLLTGTPMPNGYEDLFTQFTFLWPDNNLIGFSYDHLKRLTKAGPDSLISKPLIDLLQDNITPFFVRITKEMLALPPVEPPMIIEVELSDQERQLYDMINQSKTNIDPNDQTSIRLLKAKLIRLMQASTNPRLLEKPLKKIQYDMLFGNTVPGDENEGDRSDVTLVPFDPMVLLASSETKNQMTHLIQQIGTSSKLLRVIELLRELLRQGNKVIIWTIFIQTMIDLKALIKSELGLRTELLYGDTKNFRSTIIEEFKHSSDLMVVVANPSAVSESISLHKSCHHAIYLDLSYNATHFIQSKDRIHRLGLPAGTKTHYYFIHSKNTIDEKVYARVTLKETRMINAIENSLPRILYEDSMAELLEDLK